MLYFYCADAVKRDYYTNGNPEVVADKVIGFIEFSERIKTPEMGWSAIGKVKHDAYEELRRKYPDCNCIEQDVTLRITAFNPV